MIPLNRAQLSVEGRESLIDSIDKGFFAGKGPYSRCAEDSLQEITGFSEVVLTSSGTTALIAALLAIDLLPGERVLIPSFGFVALPQAVLLAGGIPHFVDVDTRALSTSVKQLELIDDPSIRGIILIHYGGIPGDISRIAELCRLRGWFLIEDAAHALGANHSDGRIGSFGDLSIFSFDHQKNVQAGELGAVSSHDPVLTEKLRNIVSLGINAGAQAKGSTQWDWISSGLKGYPPDYGAALLFGQLKRFAEIQSWRKKIYLTYESEFSDWADRNGVILPDRPEYATECAWHIFWLLFESPEDAECFSTHMQNSGVQTAKHYSSLRATTFGGQFPSSDTPISDWAGQCLIRLPLGHHVGDEELPSIVASVKTWSKKR